MEIRTQYLHANRRLYLDIARVCAIISISCNHAFNRSFNIYGDQRLEMLHYSAHFNIAKTMLYIFTRLGVPIFLMISGALLLNKCMESASDIKKFYKHNLLSLFITTEIWYAIIYWFIVLLQPDNMALETSTAVGLIWGMLKTMLFLDQTTLGSMWYMPMILCLYTTIPMVVISKNKVPSPVLLLPLLLVYLNDMILPAINTFFTLAEKDTFARTISQANLISMYYIYVIIGYCVNNGALKKLRDWLILLIFAVSFAGMCMFQLYAYSMPKTYNIYYEFPLLPICAGCLFEFIRRKAHWFRALARPFAYLAKISFGIYFMHVLIMHALVWFIDFSGLFLFWKAALLEAVSFVGSIAVISVLAQIRPLGKYLFGIKD